MSALKRSELIAMAIEQSGADIGITGLAEKWLDNILDRLYEDHKWPFQEKQDAPRPVTMGQVSVPFPGDYQDVWNKYGLQLEDSQGKRIVLLLRTPDYIDLISDIAVLGTPEVAIIDENTNTWRPYPLPNQSYTVRLRYKHKPVRLSDSGIEDPAPLFPNDQLLVEALFTAIMQYEDDERAVQDLAFLDSLVKRYKRGFNKKITRSDKMELNPEVFKKIIALR